jgi:hypothetical protein
MLDYLDCGSVPDHRRRISPKTSKRKKAMRTTSTLLGLSLLALAAPGRAEEAAPTPATVSGEATAAPATGADTVSGRKLRVGLSFLPMGMGKYSYSTGLGKVTADAAFAYGVALSASYEVIPHLWVGVSPQAIFNVKLKAPDVGTENPTARQYDLMARVAYALSITDNTTVYAEVLPGYSLITSDAGPKGLVVAVGAGAMMDLDDRFYVNLGGGYEIGFQSWVDGKNVNESRTRYIRIALGGGVRF